MSQKATIYAVMDDAVGALLKRASEIVPDVDFYHCCICGKPIEPTERPPRYLTEKIKVWWARLCYIATPKWYTWNLGAVSRNGAVCEKGSCYMKFLFEERNEMLR